MKITLEKYIIIMFAFLEGYVAGPELDKKVKKYKQIYKSQHRDGVNDWLNVKFFSFFFNKIPLYFSISHQLLNVYF